MLNLLGSGSGDVSGWFAAASRQTARGKSRCRMLIGIGRCVMPADPSPAFPAMPGASFARSRALVDTTFVVLSLFSPFDFIHTQLLRKTLPKKKNGTASYHCALNPLGRLRQPWRGLPEDYCPGRRLAPCRHHVRPPFTLPSSWVVPCSLPVQGWALCAQPHVWPPCRRQDPIPRRPADREPRQGDVRLPHDDR